MFHQKLFLATRLTWSYTHTGARLVRNPLHRTSQHPRRTQRRHEPPPCRRRAPFCPLPKLHLTSTDAIQTSTPTSLRMLYTLHSGISLTPHYGLALASIVPLPASVLATATHVARTLQAKEERRRKANNVVLVQRRRRLVLDLKEKLEQARSGRLQGEALRGWLRGVQTGFVVRMGQIEDELGEKGEDEEMNVEEEEEGGGADGGGVGSAVGFSARRSFSAVGSDGILQTPC